ncbi:alpha/beta fold hydrolase [Marivibrio halodurans]|uniref:Alpha/beta fold hydrolase n=1 Tax=Marivibrio halodurans TaxID=2039722 RepID=A0A8J7V153_9PROT|nr:alpha/beta fold hydrolase [Marivibrio halodurans]MBP5855761.1 alpha/beta fold hydrolase [Marivibrio halodurans]
MSDRTPLVLVPGLLLTDGMWAHQTRHLADIADIVVADTLRDDSIDAMADRLLAEAPARFALAGLSMGGYVAMAVVRKAPERVTKLALMDTQARPDTAEATRRRQGLIALSDQGKFKGVTPRLLPMLVHEERLEDKSLVDPIMTMAEAVGQAGFVRQQTAIIGRPDARPGLAEVACPTLVLCGRQDALTPLALHEEMAALVPGARLAVIEECGHLPTLERPHAATTLMRDWLLHER